MLFALGLAGATLSDPPPEPVETAVRWFLVVAILASGIGLFAGFRVAYWTSVAFLGLFGLFGVLDAIEDRDASSVVVAAILVFGFSVLWLRRPSRAREDDVLDKGGKGQLGEMSAGKRRLYVAASLAFGIFGLAMAIVGRGPDRALGLITVLFFGAGGIAMMGLFRPPPPGRQPETGFVTDRGMTTPALLFPSSRRRLALALVATLAWAVAGVLFVLYADGLAALSRRASPTALRVVGITMVVVFAPLAVGNMAGLFRRMFVALLPEGILLRVRAASLMIPWEAITAAGTSFLRGSPYFGVSVSDPAAVQASPWARWWLSTGVNRRLAGFDFTYPGTLMSTPVDSLEKSVVYYLEHPDDRSRIGSELPPEVVGTAPRATGSRARPAPARWPRTAP
jgi:hypothetical protein